MKRYTHDYDYGSNLKASPNGIWVKYADVEKLKELNREMYEDAKRLKELNREMVATADRRVKALEQLLIFYRTGRYPSEKAFNELEVAKRKWDKLKAKAEGGAGE